MHSTAKDAEEFAERKGFPLRPLRNPLRSLRLNPTFITNQTGLAFVGLNQLPVDENAVLLGPKSCEK